MRGEWQLVPADCSLDSRVVAGVSRHFLSLTQVYNGKVGLVTFQRWKHPTDDGNLTRRVLLLLPV